MQGPFIGAEVIPAVSPEARSLKRSTGPAGLIVLRPRHNPLGGEADQGRRGTWDRTNVPVDPLIRKTDLTRALSPAPLFTAEGTGNPVGCGTCTPPDPNGAAGPNHYVQVVNSTEVAIYNKSGILVTGPFNLNSLWAGVTGKCDASTSGDPVVVYDGLADRWLLAQFFEADQNGICVAVSQTSDPAGAYYLYQFSTVDFPDYFKFAVWPDGYYMSDNETTYAAYAFERAKMLRGKGAKFQWFTGQTNLLLPANLDGKARPLAGTPEHFYTFKDDIFHGGTDRLEVYDFHVNWLNLSGSTFTLANSIDISPFTYTVCGFFHFSCIKQKNTTRRIDALSEWPMFRFPYRHFGTYEALAGTFTVGGGLGGSGAAVRWFELHNSGTGWSLFQEGTVDPGDGNDRFVASIAMDRQDNLALGYSVSSSNLFPSIRYAVHRVGDAAGTMRKEAKLIDGGGSQTGSNRWGDYSAMTVDPADNLTFWYTSEYYPVTAGTAWKTRIGALRAH